MNLSLRMYQPSDEPTVCEWWQAHNGAAMETKLLPPSGVVVELDGEPAAACWLYLSFGVGVSFLEFPVSRPGLKLSEAREAFGLALDALEKIALSCDCGIIIAHTLPPIARALRRFGFSAQTQQKITITKVLRHGS